MTKPKKKDRDNESSLNEQSKKCLKSKKLKSPVKNPLQKLPLIIKADPSLLKPTPKLLVRKWTKTSTATGVKSSRKYDFLSSIPSDNDEFYPKICLETVSDELEEKLKTLNISKSFNEQPNIVEPELQTRTQDDKIDNSKSEEQSSEPEDHAFRGPLVYAYRIPYSKKFVILLEPESSLYFKGTLKFTVLLGRVEILGYVISSDDPKNSYDAFSPKTSSSLCIDAMPHSLVGSLKASSLKVSLLAEYGLVIKDVEDILQKIDTNYSLILFEKVDCNFVKAIETYMERDIFTYKNVENKAFKEMSLSLECSFGTVSVNSKNLFRKSNEWNKFETFTDKLIVCGGKGVGKSTLLSYLVNKKLKLFNKILVLDFDPGQSEFTPPGCVAAVLVEEPLLGPNYTHLKKCERMVYLGEINMSQCPMKYLNAIKYIYEFCSSKEDYVYVPWIINTMGFCKGLGVELLLNILRIVKPNNLVQIESMDKTQNFKFNLTPNCLRKRLTFNLNIQVPAHYSFKYFKVKTVVEVSKGLHSTRSFKPKDLRDMRLISYLSQSMKPPRFTLNSVLPIKIPFANLFIQINEIISPLDILNLLNGNFIGLCKYNGQDSQVLQLDNEPEYFRIIHGHVVMPCYGFGIIRGIDQETKTFYVVTPINEEEILSVNCFSVGSISPPACLYLKQDTPNAPYIDFSEKENIGAIKQGFRHLKQTPANTVEMK